MEKVNPIDLIRRLRSGEDVSCPNCKTGKLVTEFNPAVTHYFHCDECEMEINID